MIRREGLESPIHLELYLVQSDADEASYQQSVAIAFFVLQVVRQY